MPDQFLAFDLGAESGRAMLGTLDRDGLELTELHRFPNQPVFENGSMRWNISALWREMTHAIDLAPRGVRSIGVDTWGVDFALLDRHGDLIENPYHYRDRRTEGALGFVFAKIPRERIYEITGIQFLPFNTIYQLAAARLESADALLTIPDFLNYRLTGVRATEYTIASTTQLLDARTRQWSEELIDALGFPRRLFQNIVEPGTEIGRFRGIPVIAPACHDTASAVAAISTGPDCAFLSSGTWSLMGGEVQEPVITPRALELNFTNEGGVGGTIRLLKNIAGMWLLESCRRAWGDAAPYEQLLEAAALEPAASFIDPDDPLFLNPPHMPEAIAEYCRSTSQAEPRSRAALTRTIVESLARKYKTVLESLEGVTGRRVGSIRVIGGGSQNRLLNRLTAEATGRKVIAGPVEATALGNIAMQMVGTGAVGSIEEARGIIDRSFRTADPA